MTIQNYAQQIPKATLSYSLWGTLQVNMNDTTYSFKKIARDVLELGKQIYQKDQYDLQDRIDGIVVRNALVNHYAKAHTIRNDLKGQYNFLTRFFIALQNFFSGSHFKKLAETTDFHFFSETDLEWFQTDCADFSADKHAIRVVRNGQSGAYIPLEKIQLANTALPPAYNPNIIEK